VLCIGCLFRMRKAKRIVGLKLETHCCGWSGHLNNTVLRLTIAILTGHVFVD